MGRAWTMSPSTMVAAIHPIIPNLPARVDAKEVPTVPRDVATGRVHGGSGARHIVKSVTGAGSKTFRPAPPSGPPIGSHRGRVWAYVRGCVRGNLGVLYSPFVLTCARAADLLGAEKPEQPRLTSCAYP
jgi:hypothetical protein